jgi:hypothetical protein
MALIQIEVDTLYDAMGDGDRQHMANKLYKHGYVSPKAKTFDVHWEDPKRVLDFIASKTSLQLLTRELIKRYPATFAHSVWVESTKEQTA